MSSVSDSSAMASRRARSSFDAGTVALTMAPGPAHRRSHPPPIAMGAAGIASEFRLSLCHQSLIQIDEALRHSGVAQRANLARVSSTSGVGLGLSRPDAFGPAPTTTRSPHRRTLAVDRAGQVIAAGSIARARDGTG